MKPSEILVKQNIELKIYRQFLKCQNELFGYVIKCQGKKKYIVKDVKKILDKHVKGLIKELSSNLIFGKLPLKDKK